MNTVHLKIRLYSYLGSRGDDPEDVRGGGRGHRGPVGADHSLAGRDGARGQGDGEARHGHTSPHRG